MIQITIRKDEETGSPVVNVVSSFFDEEPGWFLSEGLQVELVKELESHLYQVGGEHTDFDLPIMEAIDILDMLRDTVSTKVWIIHYIIAHFPHQLNMMFGKDISNKNIHCKLLLLF